MLQKYKIFIAYTFKIIISNLDTSFLNLYLYDINCLGELAQLVERLHGMQEVSGSSPLFSTKCGYRNPILVFFLHDIVN
jgi:hypothetical protein